MLPVGEVSACRGAVDEVEVVEDVGCPPAGFRAAGSTEAYWWSCESSSLTFARGNAGETGERTSKLRLLATESVLL